MTAAMISTTFIAWPVERPFQTAYQTELLSFQPNTKICWKLIPLEFFLSYPKGILHNMKKNLRGLLFLFGNKIKWFRHQTHLRRRSFPSILDLSIWDCASSNSNYPDEILCTAFDSLDCSFRTSTFQLFTPIINPCVILNLMSLAD